MLFSERLGFKKVEDIILIDSLSETLKNRLSNIICDMFIKADQEHQLGAFSLYRYLIKAFFKERTMDSLSQYFSVGDYYEEIIRKIDMQEWYAYYDVLEFLAEIDMIDNKLRDSLNNVLEEEKSGFRLMKNNQFAPVTDEISISEIDKVIESPFVYARDHIQKSIKNLNNRKITDYNAVVSEAVKAVESCFIQVAGLSAEKKNSLGTAVKKIKDEKGDTVDVTFLKPFETLYGVASNTGIRHAGNEKTVVCDISDALLILTTCSAMINYLAVKLEVS